MRDHLKPQAWPTHVGRATRLLAGVAGLLLIFMMGLIASAVFMRYVAGRPILGVNEIVQLTAVAIAMLALPHTTERGLHVRADVFDPAIGRWGRFVGDLFTRAISIVALAALVKRAWAKTFDALEFGDATNMLGLPVWPFYALLAAGMALSIAVFVLQLATLITTRRPLGEHE